MRERKPTCEGTNYHSTGAGTHSNRMCRKSVHPDYLPFCEIHGLRSIVFKLRDEIRDRKDKLKAQNDVLDVVRGLADEWSKSGLPDAWMFIEGIEYALKPLQEKENE